MFVKTLTWPQALKKLKERTWNINTWIPESVWYEALTEGHKMVIKDLSTKNTKVANLYSRFEADLSANQERYDNFPLWAISTIELRLEPNSDFIVANISDTTIETVTWGRIKTREEYQEGQSLNKPLVEFIGNSIQIYPTPKHDVARGIRVTWKSQYVERINSQTTALLFWKLQNYEDLVISAAKLYIREYEKDKDAYREDRFFYRQDLDDALASLADVALNAPIRKLENYNVIY